VTGTALYGQDASTQVVQALETGFKHLDAAQYYSNEKSVGEGLAKYLSSTSQERSSIFVTTKFGKKRPGQTAKDVLKTELADLKLDYIDLYLIHTPEGLEGKLGELWQEFEGLKKEGLTKEIGISNFRVADLEEILESVESRGGEVPAVHQVSWILLGLTCRI
jgi:diketogulonate reductase-like aldo/keto reductase